MEATAMRENTHEYLREDGTKTVTTYTYGIGRMGRSGRKLHSLAKSVRIDNYDGKDHRFTGFYTVCGMGSNGWLKASSFQATDELWRVTCDGCRSRMKPEHLERPAR